MAETTSHTTEPIDADAPAAVAVERLPRPRIRTGAAIWGLVLVAVAAFTLWAAAVPARRAAALDTVATLSPLGWTVVIVVAVGALITLIALAAVIRRLQTRASTRE